MPSPAPTHRLRFVASLAAAGIGQAPTRARVWRAGPNAWDGGIVNLTPRAALAVMAEYERRGNPLSMDIEHAISLAQLKARQEGKPAPDEPIVTAGYCGLELVETPDGPEIWFTPRWSDCGREAPVPEKVCCARHQIESGQRDEISPDWDADPETGEPLRINRISLVLDGATHNLTLLASRAATTRRSSTMATEMDRCRAAYAWHKAMAGGEGDGKKHEDMAAELKAHAAALGIDLDKEPDGDEKPAEKPAEAARAAEPVPEPKGQEDQLPKPPLEAAKPMAARITASAPAAPPFTMASVLRAMEERDELNRLLDINKDRIPEKHRTMLASRGLAATREYVEGLPARPAPKGTDGDTGGPVVAAKVRPWRKALNEAEAFLAARVRSALQITPQMEEEFDKRVDDDGGITVSMVELVERHRAARLKARSAA